LQILLKSKSQGSSSSPLNGLKAEPLTNRKHNLCP
jgi:hypothetical protein